MRVHLMLAAMLFAPSAFGGITALNLDNYKLSATHLLPPAAAEASAITYNWTTGTLFVLGDEGDALVEVTTSGQVMSQMTLTGFEDTEGLTYIGGSQLVLVEERLQDVYLLTYSAGGTVDRSALPSVSLGPTVGNIGLEGITFDPLISKYIAVKEKTPQGALDVTLDWSVPSGAAIDLFVPALGVLDLSDVQALTTVATLIGTADQNNLLIYSQESARLMEVTRSGVQQSQFDFSGVAGDAEGVTIGPDGTIYIVGETPALYVLTPCRADVTDDQSVDINDLLEVINSWGPCTRPNNCPADIDPQIGDDAVNINDLLAVINAWGPCP